MTAPTLRTIPHTGTQFAQNIFERMGLPREHKHVSLDSDDWMTERMVFTLRDPMLSILSHLNRGNDLDVELWRIYAQLRDDEGIHFFRVDCPTNERAERLEALEDFCERKVTDMDWSPVNARGDEKGLKAEYSKGRIPDVAYKPFLQLLDTPHLTALLTTHGYRPFWMELAGV